MPNIHMDYLNFCARHAEILSIIMSTKYNAWLEGYYYGRQKLFKTL